MTNYVNKARELFDKGFNCSQSVLGAFAEDFGIPLETSLCIASGFGGGISRKGEVCGAVSGAVMAIGLASGSSDPQDKEAKEHTYILVQQFTGAFRDKHTHVRCPDLLGMDIGNPEALQQVRQQNLFETICPGLVEDAARIVAAVIAEDEISGEW